MRLTDILKPENVKLPIGATDKQSVIEELVDLLNANGELSDAAKVRVAVLDRERTRTTGIGDGVAIPHGKTDGTTHLIMSMGRVAEPVEFNSMDGKPVSLVWLLASPTDKTKPHIDALARVSKIASIATVRRELMAAKTPRQMYDIIAEQDERL